MQSCLRLFGSVWGDRGDVDMSCQLGRARERPQDNAANWGQQREFFKHSSANKRDSQNERARPPGGNTQKQKKLRTPGVEPGSQAWEACMMPLHYVRAGN